MHNPDLVYAAGMEELTKRPRLAIAAGFVVAGFAGFGVASFVFMAVGLVGLQWLHEWQTMVTGLIAVAAAIFAAWLAWTSAQRQIRVSVTLHHRREENASKLAREKIAGICSIFARVWRLAPNIRNKHFSVDDIGDEQRKLFRNRVRGIVQIRLGELDDLCEKMDPTGADLVRRFISPATDVVLAWENGCHEEAKRAGVSVAAQREIDKKLADHLMMMSHALVVVDRIVIENRLIEDDPFADCAGRVDRLHTGAESFDVWMNRS